MANPKLLAKFRKSKNKAKFLKAHPQFAKANPQFASVPGAGGKKVQRAVTGDLSAGDAYAKQNIIQSNPQYDTDFGSSNVSFDENGNPIYTQRMDETQMGLLEGSQALHGAGTSAATGLVNNYTGFQDPTQQSQQISPVTGQPIGGGMQNASPGMMGGPSLPGAQGQVAGGGDGGFNPIGGVPSRVPGGNLPDGYRAMPHGGPTPMGNYGQNQAADPFRFQMGDYGAQRDATEEAVYGRLTKNFDRNEGRELETAKQDLHNKGIPYSDHPESRYQKELRSIQDRYAEGRADASARATEMGAGELTNAYNISSGAFKTNLGGMGQEFEQGILGHRQNMSDLATLGGVGTGAVMPNLPGFQVPPPTQGTTPSDYRLALKQLGLTQQQIDQQMKIAEMQIAAASGGGGSGGTPAETPDEGTF